MASCANVLFLLHEPPRRCEARDRAAAAGGQLWSEGVLGTGRGVVVEEWSGFLKRSSKYHRGECTSE